MNTKHNASLCRTFALGTLLLLTAVATGCGVGLPTQPDLDSGVTTGRVDGTAGSLELGAPQEIVVSDNPGGGSGAGEIEDPTPSDGHPGNGNGWANGHQKNWKSTD